MYNEANKGNTVAFTTFRDTFDGNDNISFGYPREDTFSTCDIVKADISVLEENINRTIDQVTLESLTQALSQNEKVKKTSLGKMFYFIKAKYRKESRKGKKLKQWQ